eukprot:Em0002g1679a
MDKKVTDAHLVKIAKFLPKWKVVSKLLGLEGQIVKDIEDRYRSGEDQRSEALMKWVGKEGGRATYGKLYGVLLEMEEGEAAEKVKELTRVSSGPQTSGSTLDAVCNSDTILKIAMLSYDWRPLGRRLIGDQRVSDIAREEHDEQNRRERMLTTWMQQEGTRATYRRLVDVLEKLGNKATAEIVVRLVEEGEDDTPCASSPAARNVANESPPPKPSTTGGQLGANGQPTVKLLTCFPSVVDGEKKTINIIQRTGTSYEKLGMFLLEDDNGDIVDSLKEACHQDPIQITTAVYKKWISGTGRKPVTWQTLVDVLREIDLNRVADDIDSTVKAPK